MKSAAGRTPWIIAAIVMIVGVSICAAIVYRSTLTPARVEVKIVETPAPPRSSLTSISGEAFLKLARGNEMLSGMQVSLYDQSMLGDVERIRGTAADAKQNADALAERVESLKECLKLKTEAERWANWEQKMTRQRDDFLDKGYEQIQIYDPIREENVMLSWQHNRLESEKRLDTIIQRCGVRAGEATDQIDRRLHKLGYVEGKLEEMLGVEQEKLTEARLRAMSFPQVLAQAQKNHRAYDEQLTDSDGRFAFDQLPGNNYTLVATYKDPYSGEWFHWVLPVSTAERRDRKVVLSQANTYESNQPQRAASKTQSTPTPRPDTLMPARAQGSN